MRINNNLMAMNAYRQLGITNDSASKSMEKLSSGLRINRAGDDAAGLSISEKMRGQIRGLNQASRNAQDGISLIQTAEGALQETQAILQRMRELAVQSANDTNVEVDRAAIQAEINELAAEITRIAETTEFNTQKLLDGSFKGTFHIGANEGQNIKLAINNMTAQALKVSGNGEGKANYEIDGAASGTATDAKSLVSGEQTLSVVEVDNITVGSYVANYGLLNEDGKLVAVSTDGTSYALLTEATDVKDLAKATLSSDREITFDDKVISGKVTLNVTLADDRSVDTIADVKATASIDVKGLGTGDYEVQDYNGQLDTKGFDWTVTDTDGNSITVNINSIIKFVLVNSDNEVVAVSKDGQKFYSLEDIEKTVSGVTEINDVLKSGANTEAVFTSSTELTDGKKLTVKADGGIDVSTQAAADKAITIINNAIIAVSTERSKLGANQNRLEHTIKNLDTSAENLQASESRIRDVDMAKEMMEFTKNNILQQAATAMLAQANQAPQSVLQLLR